MEENNLLDKSGFIDALFSNLDEDNDSWFDLWTKQDRKTLSVPLSKVESILPQVEKMAKTKDVYFEVCLQKEKPENGRGEASYASVVPGLWFDIDIKGNGHKKNDLPTTAEEANRFLNSLNWKPTLIVSTGGGFHAYWLFKELYTIDTDEERRLIQRLSASFQTHIIKQGQKQGWKLDNTSSLVQLLRIPQTLNHKYNPPGLVTVISYDNKNRYNPDDFEEIISLLPVEESLPFETYQDKNFAPADADLILSKCSFMQHFKDNAVTLSELEWTTGLSILGQCEDGEDLAHKWSSPYPDYSPAETEKKFQHVMNKLGPFTCQTIQDYTGFEGCKDCLHSGEIKSPIQLGAKFNAKSVSKNQSNPVDPKWQKAREMFPRTDFPRDVLNNALAENFEQLARSHAIPPNPLPGVAFGTVASLIGARYSVQAKGSWKEPSILWHINIQESGSGKTPADQALCRQLYRFQAEEKKQFERLAQVNQVPRNSQSAPTERGYVTSDYTIEGLCEQISNSPHGGIYCDISELSSIISSQNQYKTSGSDRENFLKLWDGHPLRVTRKGGTKFIPTSRISLAGGIQPAVFKLIFGGKNQLYIQDGTVYRFLCTFEPPSYCPLTAESWSNENQDQWTALLQKAKSWADNQSPLMVAQLSPEAQSRFFDWRNTLELAKNNYPTEFRGFLPKAYSYCLRLTGIIHCINQFNNQHNPAAILQLDDLEKGITAIEFYLGQAVDAMTTLLGVDISNKDNDEQKREILFKTLNNLQSEFHKDRIFISTVLEAYNSLSPDELKYDSERAFASFLRSVPLNVPSKSQRILNETGTCLEYDEMLTKFLSAPL